MDFLLVQFDFTMSLNNIYRIFSIRKSIKASEPDIIISFMSEANILAIISNFGCSNVPIIVSERTDFKEYKIGIVWSFLRILCYSFSNSIVVQTENVRNNFSYNLKRKCFVIPNSVKPAPNHKIYGESKIVLAMGRLEEQKGFDVLIQAFKMACGSKTDWQLHIYGKGELAKELKDYIARNKITDRVFLKGVTEKTFEVMLNSEIFVLSSRVEGFPNVLLEAMSVGLPVISTDCNSGPRDIIAPEKDGILIEVDNINQMADAIVDLMNNESRRISLGKNAILKSKDYNEELIMEKWETLISKSLKKLGKDNDENNIFS